MNVRIHHKITFIITVIVAVILTGAFFYLNNHFKEYTYRQIEDRITREAGLAGIYLEQFFRGSMSYSAVDPIADRIGRQLNVQATILDASGSVLGDSDLDAAVLGKANNQFMHQEIQDALKNGLGKSRRYSMTAGKDMFSVARLFGNAPDQGFIRLAVPLSEMDIISHHIKHPMIGLFFSALLLTMIAGVFAFLFVTQPIRTISRVATQIAMGNYTERVSVTTRDELGDLARSMNFMSEQIHHKMEEVIADKSRFEAILLSMCEGTMVVDKNSAILLMNGVLRKLLQIDKDPIGRKPLEVIRNIRIQDIIDKVFTSQASVAAQDIGVLLDEEKILQVFAAPVLRKTEMDGAVLVFHDITALRRLENVRRDFVANASHEIRTPLTNIKGYTETLLDGALDDKDNARDFLKIIASDANRLVQLVDDLLDLSRIESGHFDLKPAPCSLEAIIDRVIAGLIKQAQCTRVNIRKDFPANLPAVQVDEPSIAQVILNLVDNGIKYNQKDGWVTISARDKEDVVRVSIQDSGIGIPAEDLPRIFERFYRVDKARSRQMGGTGLGLSIVKHIILAHGGTVSVESELGKGSIFHFTLPKT